MEDLAAEEYTYCWECVSHDYEWCNGACSSETCDGAPAYYFYCEDIEYDEECQTATLV